ncbi:MAG: HAD family phosphatase [Gemmatimonadota bacterium]|jgi:HAD superfamily hydrolase (TIGR01509 family)|nr:HAD family phosphatase [Gemmatimonadota bacterium]MDQ8146666.1 HAD family phosphatase [Gemmatimonadota bacterium]MDQ8148858.1 HAD family phosphatase [Gemmatimonadota bacterium]MDQ8156072.1 HAD family phosphatase [Gemmatimonadota bacterium]MDQ8176020.1 HAD family phosphatase [Gemmatimonadota bacterium]
MDLPVVCVELEGVVVDTEAVRLTALASALEGEGLTLTGAGAAAARGYPVEAAVRRARRALGAAEDETAVELGRLRAERAFAARIGKGILVHPAAKATLERLTSHCRLAIVTRAARREVEFLLSLAGLEALFRPVIALEDAPPGKPDHAPWQAAMDRVGQLFPGQRLRGIAVEDHVTGIRGARTAGLRCIGVGPLPAHEALEADAWLESIADLTPERLRSFAADAASP